MAGYSIEPVVSSMFDQNAYVAWQKGDPRAIVIDPGFEPGGIREVVESHKLDVAVILNTHGHSDHIAGNDTVKKWYPSAPLWIGEHEAHFLTDPKANLSAAFGVPITSPAADRVVREGERVEAGPFHFLVREIPGHSPGSVVFICEQFDPPFVFVGDVLFAGSVGRADFPGGDAKLLLAGIREKLFSLPDGTLVFPGHGPATTIGIEREHNPFVGRNAGVVRLD